MKILIVDDSNAKIGKLLEVLEQAGVGSENIEVSYTLFDAKTALRTTDFDLLILDVLLPLRAGDAPRHSGTIDLLTEIADRTTLRKPKHIIGLTAYEDAIQQAGPAFVSRMWAVIKFSFESDDWKQQIVACVAYIGAGLEQCPIKSYKTDLCIVTALADPEYAAIIRLPWNWGVSEPLDDNTFVRRGTFKSGGVTFSVTAANASRMGMVSAALLSAKLVEREVPRFLVMPGICAGIEGKVNLGDIVVADPTWDWQCGKHFVDDTLHSFAIAPEPIGLASFVRARFEQMRLRSDLWSKLRGDWPEPPETELRLKVAPMASGSSVVADSDIVSRIKDQNRNLTAIEMEAFGVAAAASMAAHPRPTAFICKAVCDFADEEKNDRWRSYSAYCSAQATREFFETYMHEMAALAGSQ
jgi:nucleoside phosphorylase/CheY-like chemotaxis protein